MTLPAHRSTVDVADFPMDLEAVLALLPEDEQEEYRRCQESVIEARRSAERIEGQLWIG